MEHKVGSILKTEDDPYGVGEYVVIVGKRNRYIGSDAWESELIQDVSELTCIGNVFRQDIFDINIEMLNLLSVSHIFNIIHCTRGMDLGNYERMVDYLIKRIKDEN